MFPEAIGRSQEVGNLSDAYRMGESYFWGR